jgi:hypothetical protein
MHRRTVCGVTTQQDDASTVLFPLLYVAWLMYLSWSLEQHSSAVKHNPQSDNLDTTHDTEGEKRERGRRERERCIVPKVCAHNLHDIAAGRVQVRQLPVPDNAARIRVARPPQGRDAGSAVRRAGRQRHLAEGNPRQAS